MSEEEIKKVEGSTTSAPASEPEKKETETIDYKAELEKEREALKIKEKQLSQAEFKIQELKSKKKNEEGDDKHESFDPEEIRRLAREEALKEVEKIQGGFVKDTFEDILKATSESPEQAELIKFHYENSIKQSGYSRSAIAEDLAKAKVLANKPKLEKLESELSKAKISKNTSSGGSAGSYNVDTSIDLSPEEESWIQKAALQTGKKPEEVRAKLLANKKNY